MPFAAVSTALLVAPLLATGPAPPSGWRWPLVVPPRPVVARRFEPPPGPYSAGHRGVDLAAAPHAAVLAAGSGTVSFAGVVAGTPVVSVVHPGGLRSTYEPVAATVRAGQPVAAGQLIGRLLPGHGDCGPGRWCLHWGLIRDGGYVDPLHLLRLGPVRLLPLAGLPDVADAPAAAVAPSTERAVPTSSVAATPLAAGRGREGTAVDAAAAAAGAGLALAGTRRRRRRPVGRSVTMPQAGPR